MEITKLDKSEISDFRNLIEIFKNVFENDEQTPNNEHLDRLLSNPHFIVRIELDADLDKQDSSFSTFEP